MGFNALRDLFKDLLDRHCGYRPRVFACGFSAVWQQFPRKKTARPLGANESGSKDRVPLLHMRCPKSTGNLRSYTRLRDHYALVDGSKVEIEIEGRKSHASNKMLHELAREIRGVEKRRRKKLTAAQHKTIFDKWERDSQPFSRAGQDFRPLAHRHLLCPRPTQWSVTV